MRGVYTATKMWHFPDRLAALAAGEPAAPVHVRIKPTNVCNHSCYFCAYRTDAVSLGQDMLVRDRIPREKMAEIVEDLVAMGVEAVTFSGGGEPLLYPGLAETITTLSEGGIRIGCLTNGSQLRGKVADAFARHGTWIRVSIDGWDPESYSTYRSVGPEEFNKVIRNLSNFSDRNSECALGASIIVDERNASHVADLSRLLKPCGVSHIKVSGCVIGNDAEKNDAYHARFSETVRRAAFRARCYFLTYTLQTGAYIKSLIVINRAQKSADLEHCLLEEMTQVLGLPNDNQLVSPSIFNDNERHMELTRIDRFLLRTLYDDRMLAGTPRKLALILARGIMLDLGEESGWAE